MSGNQSKGVISRVEGDSLAYVTLLDGKRTFAFVPGVLTAYRGERLTNLGIVSGATVTFSWNEETGEITQVELLQRAEPTRASVVPAPRHRPQPSTEQLELRPDREAVRGTTAFRALPDATRQFGKLVDTTRLRPGDLLLSRELEPDDVSRRIAEIQVRGGYAADDGRWTHAAMYVGDSFSVVEATFDGVTGGGTVRLTSLDLYSDGKNALRFRRSKYLSTDQDRWTVCVRAMSRMTQPYSFRLIASIWISVVLKGEGFWTDAYRRPSQKAIVCSTLYADAYNEATRRTLGEVNGTCVPAWLSCSDEFEDVQGEWLSLRR